MGKKEPQQSQASTEIEVITAISVYEANEKISETEREIIHELINHRATTGRFNFTESYKNRGEGLRKLLKNIIKFLQERRNLFWNDKDPKINKKIEGVQECIENVLESFDGPDLTESLQRLQAEFENFLKRNKKEAELFKKYAEEEFIRKLLPIIDSFEQGLKECKEGTEFARGMQMIYSQFQNFLRQSGVAPIEATGKFDPNLHEVMLQEESDLEEGIIIQELQKGYKIHDHVLRHSKVKISKGRAQEKNKEEHIA